MLRIEYEVIEEVYNDISAYIDQTNYFGKFGDVIDAIRMADEAKENTKEEKDYTKEIKIMVIYEYN